MSVLWPPKKRWEVVVMVLDAQPADDVPEGWTSAAEWFPFGVAGDDRVMWRRALFGTTRPANLPAETEPWPFADEALSRMQAIDVPYAFGPAKYDRKVSR